MKAAEAAKKAEMSNHMDEVDTSEEPDVLITINPCDDNAVWVCECGDQGVNSSLQWAYSDVERHLKTHHKELTN